MTAVSGLLLDAAALSDLSRGKSVLARAALETALSRGYTVATTGSALTLALAEADSSAESHDWLVRETAELESIHVFPLTVTAALEVAATMRSQQIVSPGIGHLVHLARTRAWRVLTDRPAAARLAAYGVHPIALP